MPSVVAIVPQESINMLAVAIPRGAVLAARTLPEFHRALGDGGADLAIVDPAILREDAFNELLRLLADVGTRLVIWSHLTQMTAARVIAASHMLPVEVVFRDFDSSSRLLRTLVRSSTSASAPALVVHGLWRHFAELPVPIRTLMVSLFGGAPIPLTVARFSDATGCAKRTLERAVHNAGLRGVKRLLDVARIAASWRILEDRTCSLTTAADIVGYHSVRSLTERFQDVVGVSPRRASRLLSTEALAARLVQAACAEQRGDGAKLPKVARLCQT